VEIRRIECDGAALHVELGGPEDAPTMLFLHGVGSNGRTWEWLPAELKRRRRIVRVDFRGQGRSKDFYPTLKTLSEPLELKVGQVRRFNGEPRLNFIS
jgi:pimeloyl-ACP methyl ester carboxylesterase